MAKRKITVFDFDGTLAKGDSFLNFSLPSIGLIRFTLGLLREMPSLLKWKMGRLSSSEAKERLYSRLYRGLDKEHLVALSHGYKPNYRPEILKALRRHKQAGDTIYIISASLDLWMSSIAQELGVKLLCTTTASDQAGKLNGQFLTPNCHGEEKLKRLLNAEGPRENFYLTVYGDELKGGDAALFASADEKHIVAK